MKRIEPFAAVLLPGYSASAGFAASILALMLVLVVSPTHAQDSQFVFDDNGNLAVQTAATVDPPRILGQPQNQIVAPGGVASFSVTVADPRGLSYQWRHDNHDFGFATNDSVTILNVKSANEGFYQVVLTNPSGSVTSAPAFLILDSDGDGMGDSWETNYFGNLAHNATGDSDGDGSSNGQEFEDGTDPTDPNSVRFRLLVIRDGGSVIKTLDEVSYTNGEPVTLTAVPSLSYPFHAWLGDIVTRSNPVTLVMTNNKTLYARFTPVAFTWTNGSSGGWNSETNWTPNLVPGSNDTVIIPTSVTVTLDTDADCADVVLGGNGVPTLTGSGTMKVRGNFSWFNGTMGGTGRTILEPGATLKAANTVVGVNARTLENGGTILLTGTGSLGVSSGGIVTNRPAGLVQVENPNEILGGGLANGRFDNAGVFRVSVGSGTTTIPSGLNFNNAGLVEIQDGTVIWNGGFTNDGTVTLSPGTTNSMMAGGSGNGAFDAAATASVEWAGGMFTLNPGAELTGTGLYRVGGTATITANDDLTVENLELAAGTLNGTGTLTISNGMHWTGGTMGGGGRTIIASGATLDVAIVSGGLNNRVLENAGSVLVSNTGVFGVIGGAVITNRAGALFDLENENASGFGGAIANGRFDNVGTFRKPSGTGTTTIASGLAFNNSGTVEIQTGTLLCGGSFNNNGTVILSLATTNRFAGGGSNTGSIIAPATTLVEWTGGTFTLNPGAQLSGAGLYKINGIGATVAGNADLTVQNLDLVHGSSTLSGTGALTVANTMNWTAGTMEGGGRTIIGQGATLRMGSTTGISLKRTLENGGTTLWTGGGTLIMLNGVITNRAGALFNAQNAAKLFYGGGNCRFDNAGTFRKSVSTGTTTVDSGLGFNNSGTVDIHSGILAANGGYVSSSNAVLNCALGGIAPGTGYGQLQVAGTVNLDGSLSVDLGSAFIPEVNDSFSILTAGTRNGTFANFSYPSNMVTMQLSNSLNAVLVRVTDVFANTQKLMLLSPEITGTNFKLTWTAVSNTTYRVEFNPGLSPSNWTALPGDVVGVSNTAMKFDTLTSSNRFYRVHVVP